MIVYVIYNIFLTPMTRDEYYDQLKEKMDDWKNMLVILEDDAERAKAKDAVEYERVIREVFRQFEAVESRFNEIPQMTDESFAEEKAVIDHDVLQLEGLLESARDQIKDV